MKEDFTKELSRTAVGEKKTNHYYKNEIGNQKIIFLFDNTTRMPNPQQPKQRPNTATNPANIKNTQIVNLGRSQFWVKKPSNPATFIKRVAL